MKILVLHRPGDRPGGDVPYATAFAAALARCGAEAEARPADQLDGLAGFDLAYMWAACSPDWGLPAAYQVKQAGRPLIVVPVWWDRGARERLYGAQLGAAYYSGVAATLALADAWHVHTMAEAVDCWQLVPGKPVRVLGAGKEQPLPVSPQEPDPRNYVACLARIEHHKNQLMLARACAALGVYLVCVGLHADGPYTVRVMAAGAECPGHLPWERALEVLARARVHALVSFGECIANASVEAALLGVPGVLSWIGGEPEHFGPGAVYVNPADAGDIARGIRDAWDRPRAPWATAPTWDEVAAKALAWAEELLGG